jgi:preprotein translocase subunit YajC
MKNYVLLMVCVFFVFNCKNNEKQDQKSEANEAVNYLSFGDEIQSDQAISATELVEALSAMKVGDTLQTKVAAKINEVCSKKGCWMRLDLENDEELMVRFKDYGFFMPLNAKGEVIVSGKAFITEISVDELKHYAEDAGKSPEEIDAISAPEVTYAFEANGVLLKQ